jgi:hypothetical protein
MGADAFIVFFGIRYTVDAEEVERLEGREDLRLVAARKFGLKTYWGRATDGEPYFLLVGGEVGQFGVEGSAQARFTDGELQQLAGQTRERLRRAGLEGEPAFHLQLVARY